MNIYVGIGFIFLCLAVLVGVVGIFGYKLFCDREKVEVAPKDNTQPKNN